MISTVERPREVGEEVEFRVAVQCESKTCSVLTPNSLLRSAQIRIRGSSLWCVCVCGGGGVFKQ